MSQKLKGIYEALDHGNYKNALKLCSAFLQKQPAHALGKSLQAVALERCGRRDEALQLCKEVSSLQGVDDTVFSTIQVVYRRCRQGSSIVQMYESAWSSEQENEEYAVALFFAVVRESDFAKGQQVANKLYGKFKKPKYLQWVIVSMLLQAEGDGPSKVLDLAEMMLKKTPVNFDLLKVDAENVPFNRLHLYLLQLHLSTLRLQHKYTQALELLEAGKAFVKLPADITAMRIRLLTEAGQMQEATKEARAAVLRSTDNWGVAREYVRLACSCPRVSGGELPQLSVELNGGESIAISDHGARLRSREGGEVPDVVAMEDVEQHSNDDEAWNAFLLFRHLQKHEAATGRIALLAELEVRRMTFCLNQEDLLNAPGVPPEALSKVQEDGWKAVVNPEDFKDFVCAVESYAKLFRHRTSCVFELKPFLALLSDGDVSPLWGPEFLSNEAPQDVFSSAARFRRAFRRPRDCALPEDLLDDVQVLLRRWTSSREHGGVKAAGHDDLLALAIAALVDLDKKRCVSSAVDGGGPALLDAIALAEMGLGDNPHAFQLKVILVVLYGTLGLPGAMLQVYKTMDIKNIQHESLSYLALEMLCSSGCSENLRELCMSLTQFHEDMDKDGADGVSMAFQNGVYHRVPEYLDAMDRMCRSALWGTAVMEEVLCDLGQAQTQDAIAECLGRQSVLVSTIASKPSGYWTLQNQDRCVLNSLHPLPHTSPLGAAGHTPSPGRRRGATQTTSVQSAQLAAVSSSALVWKLNSNPEPTLPESKDELSALEDMIRGRSAGCSSRLRLSAALLHALGALLHRDGPHKERLADALAGVHEAFQLHTGHSAEGEAGIAAAVAQLAAEGGDRAGTARWSRFSETFAAFAVHCACVACEAAQTILECTATKESWEDAEAKLTSLNTMVRRLVDSTRGSLASGADTGADGVGVAGPFVLGGLGVPCLWALLHDCGAVLLPVVLWCCTALPKAGSGKKVKEGQAALQTTRLGLKSLLSTLQTGFSEIHEDLTRVLSLDGQVLLSGTGVSKVAALDGVDAFSHQREKTQAALLDWHRKHLQSLRDALAARLAHLKARGTFKA